MKNPQQGSEIETIWALYHPILHLQLESRGFIGYHSGCATPPNPQRMCD